LTVVFALLASLSNALNVATQHRASIASPQRTKGWDLLTYLFKNPLWLFGWVALGAAFVFQALALHGGQMSVVQPLLVTELVFVLVLRRVWIRQSIRRLTWWSAAATCILLGLFLAMAEPQGGNVAPTSHAWTSAGVASVAVAGLLAMLGAWGSPVRRAALTAVSTAILWALVATFIKTTVETLSQFGVAGTFVHWPVYALAVTGLAAEVLTQVTLHVGPLSVSQPILVIVDPIVSIGLSVWIFGEYFTPDALRLAVGATSFVGMCVAVTVLTSTAPSTMDPTEAPAIRSP
jgi:drug/metabolite transporter (DMT)-like permease